MSPSPVCATCQVSFRPIQNGVPVIEMASYGPYRLWAADVYVCPSCGRRIVTGWCNEPIHHTYASFAERLVAARADANCITWYESARTRDEADAAGISVLDLVIDELPGTDAQWFHADARAAYMREARNLLAYGWTVSEAAQLLATLYQAARRECGAAVYSVSQGCEGAPWVRRRIE